MKVNFSEQKYDYSVVYKADVNDSYHEIACKKLWGINL